MDSNSVEAKRSEIVSYVKRYIKKNALKENSRIMSENYLAGKFGVNRNTVRGAMEILKAQGIVYSVKGKGFFVSSRPKPTVFKHDNALGFSEILGKGKRDYEARVIEHQVRKATDAEKKKLDIGDENVYYVKQLRVRDGVPIAVCISILPERKVEGFDEYLGENFKGINQILMDEYGMNHPVCSLVYLKASLPTAEEMRLLEIPQNIPLLEQRNVFRIDGVGAIEYFIVRARGDIFSFYMEFQ